jgi:energy-coupling factor transporter ATP-binding protein EcfA2
MSEMKLYTITQLADLNDEELLSILKGSWGFEASEAIDVIGVILPIKIREGKSIFFLERLVNAHTGYPLKYPLEVGNGAPIVEAFFDQTDVNAIYNSKIQGTHIHARLELSPAKERIKQNNPLKVDVAPRSASVLMEVPKKWEKIAFENEENVYLRQWVIDQYFERNKQEISRDKERLEEQLAQEKQALELLNTELKQDNELQQAQLESKKKEVENSLNRIEINEKKHKKLIKQEREIGGALKQQKSDLQHYKKSYQERIKEMESRLGRLHDFIQEKSQILLELGLLDEKEYKKLRGEQNVKATGEYNDFEKNLDSSYKKAASYIQAHMRKKGIFYRRHVIEDFFALLRTNDLIVLAGDSGSGKTNLVKSFAEAIGGKSFIIPVKPNWTSAEDLLGYYNPLEKKYIITSFLSALIEAAADPSTPYIICLDEMNLARVEYYFADFLSLLEERKHIPEIFLYSDDEASHALNEYTTFLRLINKVKTDHKDKDLIEFVDLLQDEQVNIELHKLCGFHEGDSLLNYHNKLRRILSGFINTPSSIKLPANVRIVGAINVDETTHYLSPKILDRAHVMKFENPFSMNWDLIESEIEVFDDLDVTKPLNLSVEQLGERTPYPPFDRTDKLVATLITLGNDYLSKLGIEFGFRTVSQATNYANELALFDAKPQVILNNFILHKVLPKLMFEGEQKVGNGDCKKDVMEEMMAFLSENLNGLKEEDCATNCIQELKNLMTKSEDNDWIVNYWVK